MDTVSRDLESESQRDAGRHLQKGARTLRRKRALGQHARAQGGSAERRSTHTGFEPSRERRMKFSPKS
jgi:hypothetical protein